ncbi:MAG: hypothetical protein WBA61_13785 [Aequorivita sp.]
MLRAYWQFYKSIFPFIASFSILSLLFLGLVWGFILFATISLLVGFMGFRVFYNDEYYFYYNLGITKWRLLKVSFIINLTAGLLIFSIIIIFISFVFGNLQIT